MPGPAINYLNEVTISMRGAGADDGAGTPTGTHVIFKVDTVRLRFGNSTEDHSAGQDAFEWHRITKRTQGIEVSKKLNRNDELAAILAANDLVEFSLTGYRALPGDVPAAGAMVEPFVITDKIAIITDVETELGAPSTLNFTLAPYGTGWNGPGA